MKLKFLNKHTDLGNPLVTENYVLSLERANKHKVTLLSAYLHYCSAKGVRWVPSRLKCESMPIVVPTEERIASANGKKPQKTSHKVLYS